MATSNFGSTPKLRSGKFQARFIHPIRPHTEKGTRNYVTAPVTFRTKTEARRWLDRQAALIASGKWKDPVTLRAEQADAEAKAKRDALTFGEYAETWLQTRTLAPATELGYRKYLKNHILPRWGDIRLKDITTAEVREWLPTVAVGHRNTRKRCLETMRAILNTAVKLDGYIPYNPVFGELLNNIKHPEDKPKRHEAPPLHLAQVEEIAQAMPSYTADLVRLMGLAGLRTGEARELRGKDITTDSAGRVLISIERDVTGHGKNLSINKTPKTEAGERTIYAPEPLAHNLQQAAQTAGSEGLLFHAIDSQETLSEETLRTQLTNAARKLNLPHTTPHDLRRIYITNLYRLGISENVIQRAVGHAPANVTQGYGKATNDDLARLAEAVTRATFPQTLGDNVTSIDKRLRA